VRGDIADARLYAEEEAAIARAVEARRREYATGRACARAALRKLGVPDQSIPTGPRGEPRWPPGVVGSITHCDGYRGCGVAYRTDVLALGVDAEPNRPLPARVLAAIAHTAERSRLESLSETTPQVRWDRLLFSAKESVYKTWFPLTGRRLGFGDATIAIDADRGTFLARLPVRKPNSSGGEPQSLAGRWLSDEHLILTAVALPAGGTS
jgi:4'-phosphopantetheinyl transferase EntD